MSLTNTQYDEIMRSYQSRQLERQRLIRERREEIEALSPEFSQINGQIAHISVAKARELLAGNADALKDMKAQVAELTARKANILSGLGYPADYLEPPYTCSDCQDTGYIGNQRCHCLRQAAINLVYTQSNLTNILQRENFSHFSLDYYSDAIVDPDTQISSLDAARNAYTKCRQFVNQFDTAFENILLFGNTGVGKTFLSNCIAKELLDTGHSVIYFSAHQLFELLAENAFQRKADSGFDYQNILNCDLLIIDDLGTELTNSFTSSQFFVCLNERILHRRSTLISTNLDLSDIASTYSERIFSRITSNFMLLPLFGQDIRLQKSLRGITTP